MSSGGLGGGGGAGRQIGARSADESLRGASGSRGIDDGARCLPVGGGRVSDEGGSRAARGQAERVKSRRAFEARVRLDFSLFHFFTGGGGSVSLPRMAGARAPVTVGMLPWRPRSIW